MTGGNGSSSGSKPAESGDPNTSLRLTSILLNDFNYISWANAMSLALGGRQKLSFISEKAKVPALSSEEYEAWNAQDQMVRAWILNSMEPKLQQIFQYSDSALSMWSAIKNLYGDLNNAARVFQIKRDLAELQ